MKLNKRKTMIAQAKAQLSVSAICKAAGTAPQVYRRAMNKGCRPETAGKIAAALNVPLEDILED